MSNVPVKDDGRGIVSGDWLNQNQDITYQTWLEDIASLWGTMMNKDIEEYEVPKGQTCLWWLGGPSWVLKTDEGGIAFIDVYSGPSMYTERHYCGVCKQSGSDSINWLRLNPQFINPWKFNRVDAAFCTHRHQDHCDQYTIKALLQTTDCKFVGPPDTALKFDLFEVPKERQIVSHVGESMKIPGAEVEFLMCYDETVVRTGAQATPEPYEKMCTSFLFKTSAGNLLFCGDTWFHDGYRAIGETYDIDLVTFDMGWNAPGATDKMTPYDCARVAQALNAKLAIPDHYDNWVNTGGNPEDLCNQFEMIVAQNTPEIQTCILRPSAKFLYPRDKDIKRYRFDDQRDGYDVYKSQTYGEYAKKYYTK